MQQKQITDEVDQAAAVATGNAQQAGHLGGNFPGRAHIDKIKRALDRRQRRAQFMADRGEEACFRLACGQRVLVFDLKGEAAFEQNRVAQDKGAREFKNKAQYKQYCKEIEPNLGLERWPDDPHVANGNIQNCSHINGEPRSEDRNKLVVVHRRKN